MQSLKIEELLNRGGSATYRAKTGMVTTSFDYALYQNYNLKIPFNGTSSLYNWTTGVTLRVKQVTYNFTNKGWETDISYEQDTSNYKKRI